MVHPEGANSRFWTSVPPAVRWGYPDAIAAIGVFVLVVGVAVVIAVLGIQVDADAAGFWTSLAAYLLVALIIVNASYRRGQRSLRKDFLLAFRPLDLLIGLGVGILAKVLSVLFGLVVVIVTGHIPEQGNLVLSSDPLWFLLTGVLLASLVAPFVEELLMRGLIMQTVRNSILRARGQAQPAPRSRQQGAVVVSILVSALVFTALHLYQSADLVVLLILGWSTFVFGVLNGVVVYLTGRLGSAIIAHVVFNGSSVVLLFALGTAGVPTG